MRRVLFFCSLLALAACAPPPPVAEAPPPPPPPPPAPAHFTVYFNFDSARLTPTAEQVVAHAATVFHSGPVQVVHVDGYTDRAGSETYNRHLSVARAGAVADALEHHGVPNADIIIAGFGESDNQVPTPDGVREPRNRRVEITEIH